MDRANGLDPVEALGYIDPAELDYSEWVTVGMALKEAGIPVSVWADWSSRDPSRYHSGECEKKWASFRGANPPVGAGTIIQMALSRGWAPQKAGHELGWEDEIGLDEEGPRAVVDRNWVEDREIAETGPWKPDEQLIRYLEALFEPGEYVGYVTHSFEKNGKRMPSRGLFDRTAGQLIDELKRCGGDIGKVVGDYDPETGAWIRFNPLDGKDVRNENVTSFRYALVESDCMEIEKQNAIIREMELPVAVLVHSGKKSLHAIVRIDAPNYEEYRKRVDFLYLVCKKNGLEIDRQNRNPSRLSRMPGVTRNGKHQYIVDTNLGKASWEEWREWYESVTDDLPNPESMEDVWDALPALAPPLIDGVLRQGHKMLLAGPSKAGKSYALIELCCAIAEGRSWLGFRCARGRVLYVNLELDRASCLHRFRDVYAALGWKPEHLANLDVWNLRGNSVPMDKLAPKLIRRAAKKGYLAVVIDPIYKVITGDENSADQMAQFCNQFDKVCTELGCAVIYCHHHSKGSQGNKRSIDRASGSGVFARDPDALLDLIELPVGEELRKQVVGHAVGAAVGQVLQKEGLDGEASRDDLLTERGALDVAMDLLSGNAYQDALNAADAARKAAGAFTAWRIEGTLREFPKFPPVNIWFEYPVHRDDESGALGDVDPDEGAKASAWKRGGKAKPRRDVHKEKLNNLDVAFALADAEGKGEARIKDVAAAAGTSAQCIKNWVDEHPGFERCNGMVQRCKT